MVIIDGAVVFIQGIPEMKGGSDLDKNGSSRKHGAYVKLGN